MNQRITHARIREGLEMITKRNIVATVAALAVMTAIAAAVLVAWPEQGEAARLALQVAR